MVKYLEEQDAYKSFLVGGHLASRNNIGEAGFKTERAGDTMHGEKVHAPSEYISSFSSDAVQRLIPCQKSRKSEMEGPVRCYGRECVRA